MTSTISRFIEIDENPVPAGSEVSTIRAADGARLRIAFFPQAHAHGTVILAPGWAEYIEKYFETIDDLRARGFNVAIMDWRGQGLSERPSQWRGYFDLITDDLRSFRKGPAAERFEGPYFLLTHSMAGLPALKLLARGYTGFERAALCAPMTRLFPEWTHHMVRTAASAASRAGFSNQPVARPGPTTDDADAFDGNMFTTDKRRHDRFRLLREAAPETKLIAPTFGWVRDASRNSAAIHKPGFFDGLKTPTLIISAGAERRIDGADHMTIANRNELIQYTIIPDALHEIMMERDELRTAFWREVDAFFGAALN